MNLILYYLFVYLIEAIILWLYCNRIFTSRKNTFLSLLITIGMFSLLIPVAILTNAALNAFCSFIVYLCCIVLNYDSKPVWALFHALALTILMALSEGLIAAAIPDITIYAFRDGNIHSSAFTFVILSKSVYLCISQLVTRIFSKDTVNNASIRKSTLMLYLIPVMSSIITVSLGYICLNGKLSGSDSVIVFICLVLLLSINILTFYLQQDISQKNVEYARLQIELQKETDTEHYYNYVQEVNEKMRETGGFTSFLRGLPRSKSYITRNEKFISDDKLFEYQSQIIRDLAEKESCVIVGKCADYVLKDRPNVVSIYIEAPRAFCVERTIANMGVTEEVANATIERTDKYRADYYKYYTHGNYWTNPVNYDLTLNSDRVGVENCVKTIEQYLIIKGLITADMIKQAGEIE